MKDALRNSIWLAAFLGVGIFTAFIAMGHALGGGLTLSTPNASYSIIRGLIAGLIFGHLFLLFWLSNKIASTKSRLIELTVFGAGWYLSFYLHVAGVAGV